MSEIDERKIERFRGWILGLIDGIDPVQLVQWIKANKIPPLYEYDLPNGFGFVKDYIIGNKEEILSYITFDNTMQYGIEYKPELMQIFEYPKARRWLKNFLKMLRFIINNADLNKYQMKKKFFAKLEKSRKEKEKEKTKKAKNILEEYEKEFAKQEAEAQKKEIELEQEKEEYVPKETDSTEPTEPKVTHKDVSEEDILRSKDDIFDMY